MIMKKGLITCGDKEFEVDVPEYVILLFNLTDKTAWYEEESFDEIWNDAYNYCVEYFNGLAKELLPSIDLDDYGESFCVPKKDGIIIHYSLEKFPN